VRGCELRFFAAAYLSAGDGVLTCATLVGRAQLRAL
jgi:hypothetical protein